MSTYTLNKMIREINRIPARREQYFRSASEFASGFDLSEGERAAFVAKDVRALYKYGVHGLILRPFTLLHKMPEQDYLNAIRG